MLLIKFIMIISLLLIINYNSFLKYDTCISLIIPSTENDFLRCYRNTFSNFRNFIFTKEIIIVVSSVSNITRVRDIANKLNFGNKLRLGIRKNKYNAASNRNYGYKLSNCDIISFFDIDDLMSENRLAIIYHIFKNDISAEIILHKYTQSCEDFKINTIANRYNTNNYNISYDLIRNSYYKISKTQPHNSIYCCKYIKEIKNEKISNGWSSMRRYLFNKLQFNSTYNCGEDSDFNTKAILSGYNLMILNMTLGYYIKDNTCKRIC